MVSAALRCRAAFQRRTGKRYVFPLDEPFFSELRGVACSAWRFAVFTASHSSRNSATGRITASGLPSRDTTNLPIAGNARFATYHPSASIISAGIVGSPARLAVLKLILCSWLTVVRPIAYDMRGAVYTPIPLEKSLLTRPYVVSPLLVRRLPGRSHLLCSTAWPCSGSSSP